MATPKGVSGNPSGRPKHSGEWAEALRKKLHESIELPDGKRQRRLDRIACKVCTMAEAGDLGAIKEIGDRIDGKPTQPVSGDLGGVIYHIITGVPREDEPAE